ncbi:MAG: oxidoreductase [Bacillota bacterium]
MFTETSIGSIKLKNRFVMAPMHTNSATPDRLVSDELINYYRRRALGEVALIIVEMTMVSEESRTISSGRIAGAKGLGIFKDDCVPGLKKLVGAVHDTGAKVALQLGDSRLVSSQQKPADLDNDVIRNIINNFVDGAIRTAAAGFDAVELHMAHRYTLSDFLSRRGNQRKDEYGGGVEGRARIATEIISRIKGTLGQEYPVIARINGDDFQPGGNTLLDAVGIARLLVEHGADAIHVSAGGRTEDGGNRSYSCHRQEPGEEFPLGPNVYLAAGVKKALQGRVPVIAVGKILTPEYAEEIISEGQADLVALGRPLLADANFVKKSMEGNSSGINTCITCNNCLMALLKDDRVKCFRGGLNKKS